MNVAAHQENKNTGKKASREKKRQTTDFRETECCPSVVVQRAAGRNNDWMWRVPGVTGTLGKASSHFHPPQTGSGTAPPR